VLLRDVVPTSVKKSCLSRFALQQDRKFTRSKCMPSCCCRRASSVRTAGARCTGTCCTYGRADPLRMVSFRTMRSSFSRRLRMSSPPQHNKLDRVTFYLLVCSGRGSFLDVFYPENFIFFRSLSELEQTNANEYDRHRPAALSISSTRTSIALCVPGWCSGAWIYFFHTHGRLFFCQHCGDNQPLGPDEADEAAPLQVR